MCGRRSQIWRCGGRWCFWIGGDGEGLGLSGEGGGAAVGVGEGGDACAADRVVVGADPGAERAHLRVVEGAGDRALGAEPLSARPWSSCFTPGSLCFQLLRRSFIDSRPLIPFPTLSMMLRSGPRVAGGGIRPGTSFGESDEWSWKARIPTYCYDLHANDPPPLRHRPQTPRLPPQRHRPPPHRRPRRIDSTHHRVGSAVRNILLHPATPRRYLSATQAIRDLQSRDTIKESSGLISLFPLRVVIGM